MTTASTRTLSVSVLLLALAGCSRNLDMEAIKTSITAEVKTQTGLEIASVECPTEARPVKLGDAFTCTAVPRIGGRLVIKAAQKDDQGNITWEVADTQGLLDLTKIETAVTQGLREQTSASDATVSCGGGKWKAAKAGDQFDCTAKAKTGDTAIVTIKVSEDGKFGWELK